MSRFEIADGRSTILVAARSSMGPIVFETNEVRGWVEATVTDAGIETGDDTAAHVEIDITSLHSGNDVYDAELRRRLDTRRFPTCSLDLVGADANTSGRFSLRGDITFHGTTRQISGTVEIERAKGEHLLVTGDKQIDIRDFAVPAPGILMLKIYPEVEVRMFVEAIPEGDGR